MRTAEKVEVADFEELTILLKRYLDPDTDFGSLLVDSELPADSTRKGTNHHLGEGALGTIVTGVTGRPGHGVDHGIS
jgi:hypothetical protein